MTMIDIKTRPTLPLLNQISTTLDNGGVIVFPTDTVWGIGASISSPEGIVKLYQIKNRPPHQPTAVLVSSLTMARKYGNINSTALNLINHHWPGALTLVVKPISSHLPSGFVGVGDTIALRAPDHSLVQQIITHHQFPLVASSANFANHPPPLSEDQIHQDLLKQIDMFIPGKSGNQPSSTIVDTTSTPPKILRQGPVRI